MVTIRRSARLARGPGPVRLFWGQLADHEVEAGVTDPARTVVDCARVLALPDALAVADAARRSGVSAAALLEAASASPRIGRSRAVRVAEAADPRAASVFESLLRGLALEVPHLHVVPQVHIGGTSFIGAADLVDIDLGIVIEAESWRYHGGRAESTATYAATPR